MTESQASGIFFGEGAANMESVSIDWIAVLIAAVLNMVINYVWYSKWLFQDQWLSMMKMKLAQMKGTPKNIISSAVVSFLLALFLCWFEMQMGVVTVQDGLFVGFCAWLGFVATTQISDVIWCKKPFNLFLIETGNRLLAFLVMGGILGA